MNGVRKGISPIVLLTLLYFVSCSQQIKDRDIKADITVKAKTEIAFAGVSYTVSNGTVNLAGLCPSQKEKDKAEAAVKKIAGVKDVVNSITIGPVILDEDFSLKQSVDSVLMKYNEAVAQVENGTVVLTGKVPQEDAATILDAIDKLPVSTIINQLRAGQ